MDMKKIEEISNMNDEESFPSVKDDDDIELETSSESEDNEVENESIRALMQYRLLYEQKKEAEAKRYWIRSVSMWSIAVENLSTALRILAPTALFSLFYGYDSLLFRIIQQCDRAVRSVLFNKKEQESSVLKWLQDTFPEDKRAKSLDAVWANGSLICELVESVIPGSCPGHDTQCDLSHGQRLAEQYLGVTPIFSNEDLSQKLLTTYQECRLTHYLCSIKDALHRLSPPVSRTGSPILNMHAYTLDYVARGMGLMTASKNRKATFYLYPTAQQGIEPGDISIQIKGPANSYGSILVPAIYGRMHIVRNVFYNLGHRQSLKDMQLPIIKSSTTNYTIASDNYVKKLSNDIEVSILIRNDKVKVSYTTKEVGYHELSMISKGCHIMGSPFRINVEQETIERTESRDFEEEINKIEPQKNDRKIVFRIVDFVTEKMLLTEDGTLEKISNEDAKVLLQKADSLQSCSNKSVINNDNQCNGPDLIDNNTIAEDDCTKSKPRFNNIARKVLLMLRICREMKHFTKIMKTVKDKNRIENTSTPDIVNSTRKEENFPKCAEYLRNVYKNRPDSFYNTKECNESQSEEISTNPVPSIDIVISSFDDEIADIIDIPIVAIERPITPEIDVIIERPKTPVVKILDGDIENYGIEYYNGFDINNSQGQFDSLITEPIMERDENAELLLQIDNTDEEYRPPSIEFHIGEPVTPTHMMALTNLDGDMDSIILASNLEEALSKYDSKIQKTMKDYEQYHSEDSNPSHFTTPLRQTPFEQMTDNEILQMYDGSLSEESEICQQKLNNQQQSPNSEIRIESSNATSRVNSVDTWDSAYMSIDDINSSPENNSHSPVSPKSKLFVIEEIENDMVQTEKKMYDEIDVETYSKMGPAEKEFWKSINGNQYTNETSISNSPFETRNYSQIIQSEEISIPITPKEEENNQSKNINEDIEIKIEAPFTVQDDSASDFNADVKRSLQEKNDPNQSNTPISLIQTSDAESEVSRNDSKIDAPENQITTPTKKPLSKMVSEKKEYWDDKIKTIVETEEQTRKILKKRSSHNIRRNDSLNKKREQSKTAYVETRKKYNTEPVIGFKPTIPPEETESLVARWKKYWNERIESMPAADSNTKYFRKELAKARKYLTSPDDDGNEVKHSNSCDELSTFLDLNDAQDSSFVSKLNGNQTQNKCNDLSSNKYIVKSMSMSNLSERIDKFLDTASIHSPVENDDSRFSTPENIIAKIDNIQKLTGDEELITKFDNDRIQDDKSFQFFIERPAPIPIEINFITSLEDIQEINTQNEPSDDKNIIKYSIDIKSKIENYNENLKEKARQSFLKNKSKTIDIPRESSFTKLKKYFSLETIEKFHVQPNYQDRIEIRAFSSLTENPTENFATLKKENSISVDSIPTLSEKKARIEKHLINIQNRIKLQADIEKLNQETKKDQPIKLKNTDVCRENDITIKEEIRSITKPIGSLVAAFENQSTIKSHVKPEKNKIYQSKITVAENCRGAPKLESQSVVFSISKPLYRQIPVIPINRTIEDAKPKENDEKNENDEADEEIRTENYKERFQKAKAFFQTLEPAVKTNTRKLNECERLLHELNMEKSQNTNKLSNTNTNNSETKTMEIRKKHRDVKTTIHKRRSCEIFSAPASDTEIDYSRYVWGSGSERLIKISERFHVQNLFRDVVGETNKIGIGIFKGIPHKNAVLAAFQSMENINQVSSYKYTESQLEDFVKGNGIIKSQTYHAEYPYLPMTDPSKYRSRYDMAASGLITRKDLLKLQKQRRNSAPSRTIFHYSRDNINL